MKTIKVRATGAVEIVSDEYFNFYQPGGWFYEVTPEIEVPTDIPTLLIETPKKARVKKEEPKE